MAKLSKTLSGIAGEYLVAGKLILEGFHSAITLRNNEGIDILASNPETGKNIMVQVKTSQNKRKWPLNKKVEIPHNNLFYIFVNIISKDEQEYFIISSNKLAPMVKSGHQRWLEKLGRNGKKHNDTTMREFSDKDKLYLNKWELLNK